MNSCIILGRILQRFSDLGYSKVEGYNQFNLIEEGQSFVVVSREKGKDTKIYFKSIIAAIEGYQNNYDAYKKGPNELRNYGIKFTTSPIFSLLHLLDENVYYR